MFKPSCYVCNRTFLHFEALLNHFKYDEFLSPTSTYQCNVPSCPMRFQNLFRFKRHYLIKHTKQKSQDEVNTETPCLSSASTLDVELFSNATSFPQSQVNLDSSGSVIMPSDIELLSLNPSNSKSKLDDIINVLSKTTLDFKTKMHNKHNFSRNDVQEIQNEITEHLTTKICSVLNDYILPKLDSENDKIMVNKLFEFCAKPFEHIKSEHLYFKQLKELNVYVEPTEFVINNEIVEILRVGEPTIQDVKLTGILMPISFIFKKFFELPEVLEKTFANTKLLENLPEGEIANFINCKVWKERIKSYQNKICIPFFLYFDDFEINDPLKPHTCGIGAALINFPTLPTEYLSVLENIFPALFFKSEYKKYGNNATFDILINEINRMQDEGIEVVTPQGTYLIHFILGLIIGDNLGIHTILGFVKNFSSSNYPCRTCKMHKTQTKASVKESIGDQMTVLGPHSHLTILRIHSTFDSSVNIFAISYSNLTKKTSSEFFPDEYYSPNLF